MNEEKSEFGDLIYRYPNIGERDIDFAVGDPENMEIISDHIEKYVGKIESVLHEIISDVIHIDIYWVKPTKELPFHTLVTSGMSELPMNTPEELEGHKHVELCVLLPESWDMEKLISQMGKDSKEIPSLEEIYWPIRWLKEVARFTHIYNTWVGYGHTIPNGENADGFADNTKLGCILLMPSMTLGEDFFELEVGQKTIRFYCMYPLYKEEVDYKLKNGLDNLLEKFDEYQVSDIIDISRENTCLKRFKLW